MKFTTTFEAFTFISLKAAVSLIQRSFEQTIKFLFTDVFEKQVVGPLNSTVLNRLMRYSPALEK